jgi:hypothetical protein
VGGGGSGGIKPKNYIEGVELQYVRGAPHHTTQTVLATVPRLASGSDFESDSETGSEATGEGRVRGRGQSRFHFQFDDKLLVF